MSETLLAVLNLVGQTALVLAAVMVAALACPPSLRVRLARAALVIALLAPLTLAMPGPRARLLTLPAAEKSLSTKGRPAPTPTISRPTPFAAPGGGLALALGWLAGVAFVVSRWSGALLRLRRAYNRGRPASPAVEATLARLRLRLGVRVEVGLRLSDRTASACAYGWLRPRILVPMRAMSPQTMEAVLAHELCHIRARDPLWLLVAAIACAVYWFNPLVWACARRHRHDIELACDDTAAREAVDAGRYAIALIQAARAASAFGSPAAAAMDKQGLAARVRRLLSRRPAPPLGARARLGVHAAAAAVLGLVAATRLVGIEAAGAPGAVQAVEGERELAALGFHAPRHRPNERVIFFDAPNGVSIYARGIGFLCDGIRCVATVPARARVRLTAEGPGKQRPALSGCTPAASACWVEPSRGPALVAVRAGA